MPLIAPFPYFGGKRRAAPDVWAAFGDPDVYVEPFAGSLAVLLHRDDPVSHEIVTDTNGHIVNFWRALRTDPEQVAYWADYPTYHHDLTARHRWLVATQGERAELLRSDPDYCDVKAAGWWVWTGKLHMTNSQTSRTDLAAVRFKRNGRTSRQTAGRSCSRKTQVLVSRHSARMFLTADLAFTPTTLVPG